MKSENNSAIDAFWDWFESVAGRLTGDPTNSTLVGELDARVSAINPHLSWELGPGISKPWQLVVSPNLDAQMRDEARRVISLAPDLADWEFHAARQPRQWDYRFELVRDDGESLRLDASTWTFVLLRHPDGAHEVLLSAPDLPSLSAGERWHAAAVVLEGVLGEELMMDRIDEFELVDQLEARFAQKQRPIRFLREALSRPSQR